MKKILILIIALFLSISYIKAEEVTTNNVLAKNAKSAIMIEASTGNILYEFNSHEKLEPASMTKMMSLLLIMEAIDKNVITMDQEITVSSNASSMGGSQILLETNEVMKVEDLLKGVAIASWNDAVVSIKQSQVMEEEITI